MQRESALTEPGRIVHVVGRVTDEVFSFLGPATHALARTGRDQIVVMIDELRHRRHVVGLHASAELILVPGLRNPLRQWSAVRKASRTAIQAGPLFAVHLHGFLPGLVCGQLMRKRGAGVQLVFSPHSSRAIGRLHGLGQLALLLMRPLLRTTGAVAVVNVPRETQAFSSWESTQLVESPVNEVFFAVRRNEARHPLIVTGGRSEGTRNAELLAQLAVLLSGEDLRISFNWIGTVDSVSCMRLSAAGVGVFDVGDVAKRASRLAAGWIYLAPGGTRGFPLFLVEAMAAGLPCVARDCVQHRDVIREGENGYLCASEREMMERMATLIDDPALRERVGRAARADAQRRFRDDEFGAKLLAAYALLRESVSSLNSGEPEF